MHKLIEKDIKDLESSIEHKKKMEEDLNNLESIINFGFYNVRLDYEINIRFVADSMQDVKDLLKLLAEHKIFIKEGPAKGSVQPRWILQGKNTTICIMPTWKPAGSEGAKCYLVQVGEEINKYPKYKLVCEGKENEL
jgi:hypothetical protein